MLFAAAVCARHHHAGLDALMTIKHRDDLGWLDPMAEDFYLIVDAAEVG